MPDSLLSTIRESLAIQFFCCGRALDFSVENRPWRVRPFDVVTGIRRGCVRFRWGLKTEEVVAREGSIVVIPAGTRRRLLPEAGNHKIELFWMNLGCRVLGGGSVLALFDTPVLLPPTQGLFDRIDRRLNDWHDSSLAGKSPLEQVLLQKCHGMELLSMLLPALKMGAEQANGLRRLAPVLVYLGAHWRLPLTVGDMAQLIGLSESRFHCLFRKVVGEAPQAYLRRLRLEQAANLLRETNFTLADIAARTGFSDQFHLSRWFVRIYHLSPSDYRKKSPVI